MGTIFDDIGSAISSALTPPNYHAALTEQQQQQQVANDAYGTLQLLQPTLNQEAQFGASEEMPREQAITQLQYLMNPTASNPSREALFNNQSMSQAAQAVNQAVPQASMLGYSPALSGGNALAINNAAANADNQYAGQLNSYQNELGSAQGELQAINGGISMPQMNNLGTLAAEIYKQPQIQVGQSAIGGFIGPLMSALAPAAGTAIKAAFTGLKL